MNDVSNVGSHVLPDEDFSIPTAAELAAPEAAAPVGPNGFELLGLAPELVQAVADMGYTEPTAVQNAAIPKALTVDGVYADLMVSSQTGSGKTAAFLLPVLHTLLDQKAQADAQARAEFDRLAAEAAARGEAPPKRARRKNPTQPRNFQPAVPGALVLCPTRELAQQVAHLGRERAHCLAAAQHFLRVGQREDGVGAGAHDLESVQTDRDLKPETHRPERDRLCVDLFAVHDPDLSAGNISDRRGNPPFPRILESCLCQGENAAQ